MLRKIVVSTAGKRAFLDAEYHVNAFLVNFNALDQRADQFPLRGIVEEVLHFKRIAVEIEECGIIGGREDELVALRELRQP